MNDSRLSIRSMFRTTVILAVLVTVILPGAAAAQGGLGLPLPDAIFYGTVSRDGEDVESGAVKVRLPDGTRLSAEIGEITGTDYSWQLAVPLRMYVGGTGPFEDGTARRGETLQFFVDSELALFQSPINSQTTSDFTIPTDANGETYVLDLEVRQPDGYPLGDVNLSGRRDSADGLLVLRYDIGLMAGTTDFPPGPGRIYLPLCDITGDGQCNSSDALRILQCDAMMAGVSCPNDQFLMQLGERPAPSASANLALITELIGGERSGEVTIRIAARDTRARLGAISAELHFDTDLFEVVACAADPEEWLDVALCGGDVAAETGIGAEASAVADVPGLLRLTAVAAEGFGDNDLPLAEVTLRAVDPAALDAMIANAGEIPAELLSVTVAGAHDVDGEVLPWRAEGLLDATPAEVLAEVELGLANRRDVSQETIVGEEAGSQDVEPSSSREPYAGLPAEPFEAVSSVFLPLVGYVDGN